MLKHKNIGKKNILVFTLLLSLAFLMSFVSSARYETHQVDSWLNSSITSNNATACNISSANTQTGVVELNYQTIKSGQTFYYYLAPSNFSSTGDICFNIVCTDGQGFASGSVCRTITPNGGAFDISQAILFGFIFFSVVGILAFGIYGLIRASEVSWQIFYICMTYLMMFCLFFISWLFTKNYLYEIEILASIFWILWFILAICFWPFIIGISGYLLKLQAEALMVQEYQQQGFSKEDSRELAKTKRRR